MDAHLWPFVDFLGSFLILVILAGIWYWHFRAQPKRVWKCVRYQGGGAMVTPRKMSVEEVTRWLGAENNCEVAHVDHDYGFIFYRPRS